MGFLDNFRYPGFNLTSQPQLPTSFGPVNQSTQIQGAIGGLLDPILARLEQQRQLKAGEGIYSQALSSLGESYKPTVTPTSVTPPGQSSPTVATTAGSPAGDDTAGIQSGRAAGSTAAVSNPVAPGLQPHETALLNGIAKPESGGRYDIRYTPGGGTTFAETGQHPGIFEPGPAGQSSAAGRYQFTKTTWDRLTGGEVPFTRENQDLMALKLAREDYAKRTKRDLDADLLAEGFSPRIQSALSPTWAGLAGNKAQNAAVYNSTLAALGPAKEAAFTPAPAPQAAPVANFAPQVAPAATPQAAVAVTAPQGGRGPAPAPQGGGPGMNDYAVAISKALKNNDQETAAMLAQERDMVLAQQKQAQAAPTPQAAPQAQQQGSPQDQQLAQQQEVIANVGRGNQELTQRLNQQRQAGEAARVQVASLSPELPNLNLGSVMPGAQQQPQQQPPRPPPAVAAEPSVFSPEPMATPQFAAGPPAPAGPSPAAPAAAAAGAPGPPPPAPAAVPPPIRVAQAQGLPPVVSDQQGTVRPISDEQARRMLAAAVTPEQQAAVFEIVRQSRQGPALKTGRFTTTHDKDGNWVTTDTLTGATRVNPAGTGPGSAVTKEVREAERQLFNDFESTESVKKYRELEQGVQGLKAAFSSGNANADLIAIVQLFKAIDPGSTVTGAEAASVKNAAGVPETLRALFNRGFGEGGQFSPALRAEIFNTARALQENRLHQVAGHADAYRNRAKAYGLDPDRTVAFKPYKFDRATKKDFPDYKREDENDEAPAVPRPGLPGSSQATPLDMPNQAAAEAQPKGTWVRLPPSKPGGKPIIAVVE